MDGDGDVGGGAGNLYGVALGIKDFLWVDLEFDIDHWLLLFLVQDGLVVGAV